MMDFQVLSVPIISFIGGVVGGVAVNRITYVLQKRDEKKNEIRISKLEYQNRLRNKLSEIAQAIQSTIIVQYELDTFKKHLQSYSTQLTSIISEKPFELSPYAEEDLLNTDDTLRELSYYFLGIGHNVEDEFETKCQELIERIYYHVLPTIDSELYEETND